MSSLPMTTVTRATGFVLIAVGIAAYVGSGAASLTALLPAGLGLVILVLGLLASRETLRRHAIHGALAVALLGALGAIPRALPAGEVLTGGDVERPLAAIASLLTVLVCAVFIALGVRSFIAARRTA